MQYDSHTGHTFNFGYRNLSYQRAWWKLGTRDSRYTAGLRTNLYHKLPVESLLLVNVPSIHNPHGDPTRSHNRRLSLRLYPLHHCLPTRNKMAPRRIFTPSPTTPAPQKLRRSPVSNLSMHHVSKMDLVPARPIPRGATQPAHTVSLLILFPVLSHHHLF
jgi:hypothetical protein